MLQLHVAIGAPWQPVRQLHVGKLHISVGPLLWGPLRPPIQPDVDPSGDGARSMTRTQ